MIVWLTDALDALHILNAPDEDTEYYLHHLAGYNLSCSDGLILSVPDTMDITQRFRLIPVEDKVNTYNIYTNGMYVTVNDGMLALTETPRDVFGEFVAEQVSSNSFTLLSMVGYMGTTKVPSHVGDVCVPNAENKVTNVRWKLVKATEPIDDAVNPLQYKNDIDYTVIYDKDSETIRFVSDDMRVLAEVEVCIYTVGGRLLYSFSADKQRSVNDLPSGTYIVRWRLGDMERSAKFKK
jgi:hypothetical protein